jgi:hypothetical protein
MGLTSQIGAISAIGATATRNGLYDLNLFAVFDRAGVVLIIRLP